MRAKRRFCFQHDMDALVAQEAQAEAESLRLEQEAAAAAPVGDEALRLKEQATAAEKAEAEAVAAPSSDHSKATGDLSERQTKWKEVCDGASGKVYYYNLETRETTWNREAQRPRIFQTQQRATTKWLLCTEKWGWN